MKKTDIGVVAFIYAVALFFLSMTLKLPKPAQAYPLFIIVLLLGLELALAIASDLLGRLAGYVDGVLSELFTNATSIRLMPA